MLSHNVNHLRYQVPLLWDPSEAGQDGISGFQQMYGGGYPGAHQQQANTAMAAFSSPFFAQGSAQHLPAWFQSVDQDRSGKINVQELQVSANQNTSPSRRSHSCPDSNNSTAHRTYCTVCGTHRLSGNKIKLCVVPSH